VEALIESGEIKVWKAEEIAASLSGQTTRTQPSRQEAAEPRSSASGKVILLGEHAVVYGRHAVAAPIPLAIEARVRDAGDGIRVLVPRWGVEQRLKPMEEHPQGVAGILAMLIAKLDLEDQGMDIEVFPHVPKAMGLGGSAALAVAIVRALDSHFRLGLDDARVNALAFECEKAAHGTPSGVDNTVATYGRAVLYHRDDAGPHFDWLTIGAPLPIVIGVSGRESLTANHVAKVRAAWQRQPARYERLFDDIDALALAGAAAIRKGDLAELGELMNLNHGLLNALQLSTPELEELIHIARRNGALGAKLTGGGGGGSMVALTDADSANAIAEAMEAAGYQTVRALIGTASA
jgi:hydroxymethylglutaryl-CoA reductase